MRKFLHCFLIGTALSLAFASSPIYAINASVDVSNVTRTVPENALSLHSSVYANQFTNSQLDNRLIEAGVQQLRYPGGSYADIFHFSIPPTMPYYTCCNSGLPDVTEPHPVTPDKGADPAVDPPGDAFPFAYQATTAHFGTFMNLLDATGADAMITVNYGSSLGKFDAGSGKWLSTKGGQPAEAAAWVAYANANASIYGTGNDIDLGVDAEGIDWKTAGYWAKLRESNNANDYEDWATTDGVYDPANAFLAKNHGPIGIKNWEIGNEINGNGYYATFWDWEEDLHGAYDGDRVNDPQLAPAMYATNLVQFSQLMKSVDPTIQIGAGLVGPGGAGDDANPAKNWDTQVLQTAGDTQVVVNGQNYNAIDFGIYHWYINNEPVDPSYNGDFNTSCDYGTAACEANILSTVANDLIVDPPGPAAPYVATPSLPTVFNELYNRIETYTDRDASTFPIHMTEFGYFDSIGTNNPVTGLFVGDVYTTALEEGAETVHFLEMSSLFLTDSGSLGRLAAFRGFQMLDLFFDPGDEIVDVSSDSANLKIHAVKQADGTVAIMLINIASGTDASVNLDIDGLALDDEGTQWLWGVDNPNSNPAQSPLTGIGNDFMITVPDRTMLVLLIPSIEEPLLIGDYNNDGKVSAADYTVWRDSVGAASLQNRDPDNVGPVDLNDYDSWIDHYGEMSGEGSGSAILAGSVPEPSSLMLACLALVALATRFRARPRMA